MGLNDVTANGVVTLHYRIFVLHRRQNKDIPHQSCITPGASKGTPGTQNASRKPSEDINKEIKGGQNLPFFLFQGKISALNRLNSQINVLMFMFKML